MKKNQARRIAKNGRFYGTYEAMWSLIPDSVKKSCNSAELADLVDVLRYQYVYGWGKGFDEGKECGKFEIEQKFDR